MQLEVEAIITVPPKVTVALIRADHASTVNIFRICFEVFLSLFSSVLGFVIGLKEPSKFHWLCVVGLGVFTVAFLITTIVTSHKAHKACR